MTISNSTTNFLQNLFFIANPEDTAKLDRGKNHFSPNNCGARFKILCWGFFLILLLQSTLLAQDREIKFERLGLEHGLSQSFVSCILQDRQGFMWFGTLDGLNKYDGYNFIVYKHDVLDSSSLSDNAVLSICEGRDGTLWIGTGIGLNRFDRATEQFTRFVNDPKNPHSLSNNMISPIYEDHLGTLWIGTSNGLNRFDREKVQFTRFVNDPNNSYSISSNHVRSIYEDSPATTGGNTLWIGTSNGLNRFDFATERFTRFVNAPNDPHSLSHNFITSIHRNSPRTAGWNMLWIGTLKGLNRFDFATEQFARFVNDSNNRDNVGVNAIQSIYEDRAGTLWLGTGNGLSRFDRAREQFTRFVNDPKNPHSLSTNRIGKIYEDRAGALWIGTAGGGLNKLDRAKERFIHFAKDPKNPHSLSENSIGSIYEDRAGALWIGTGGGGLNKFDRAKERFIHFVNDPKNPHSLSSDWINSIYEDHTGTLWIGTADRGLNKFDREKERFIRFVNDSKNPHSLSDYYVSAICEDHTGTLWVGTQNGLNKLDRAKEQFSRFLYDANNPYGLSENRVRTICEDHTGILWIGTDEGLNKYDREKEQFARFVHEPKNPHSLSHDAIASVYEDHSGTLWVGTDGGGLNRFDRDTEQFAYYTERDGLPNNTIWGILEDNEANLWLSTNKGLSRFDPRTKTFRNYDVSNGLQGNEFTDGAYYKSKSGEMFFGGPNGFNAFYPDSIKDNPYIPPVVITAFKHHNLEAQGKPIVEKGISAKQHITLSYKDNVLTFEFAALSYRNTLKNQYAYKLDGFNDNWIYLGTKRDATFTNLDPGTYTFRVKGSNNDGVWNEAGASLRITIMPPWWKTWWAYALYLLAGVVLLFAGRRYELARARLKFQLQNEHAHAEQLAEIDRMKSRFFANISHEFRTPLTLILGPLQKLLMENFAEPVKQQFAVMLRNAERLQRLINQMLDLARLEAGKMTLAARHENIVKLTELIVMSFLSFAERKRISLQFEAEQENIAAYIDHDKWEKIISNLLSNALKFTPEGGRVQVRVAHALAENPTPQFEVRVRDTGTGIPMEQHEKIFDRFYQVENFNTREHEGTGIGLALTKELVELHHGKITLESALGQGSTFIVRMPLGRAHLHDSELAPPMESDEGPISHQNVAALQDEKKFEAESTALTAEENLDPEAAPLVLCRGRQPRSLRIYSRPLGGRVSGRYRPQRRSRP